MQSLALAFLVGLAQPVVSAIADSGGSPHIAEAKPNVVKPSKAQCDPIAKDQLAGSGDRAQAKEKRK